MGLQDPHPFNFADLKDKNLHIHRKTLLLGAIFLLLILISTFTFIRLLYACIRRGPLIVPWSITGPWTQARPTSSWLDKSTISFLPIFSYGSSPMSANACRVGECSICLGAFQGGEEVKVLPTCHHGFHSECVDEWLLTQPSCPLCRAPVVRVESLAHSDIL